jgi:hypothetical protein
MVTLLVAVPFCMAVALTVLVGCTALLSARFIVATGRVLISVVCCSLGSFCRCTVLQQCYIQGVQFMCCSSVIYRVFNLCVAAVLYTGCSIYVLQQRHIQGVQFVCCSSIIYRVFNLCVAGVIQGYLFVLLERYIQGDQFK